MCPITVTIYLKKHNQSFPISHSINTRYARNNFSVDWPTKKTRSREKYSISRGTQFSYVTPKDLANMSLPHSKNLSHWLRLEYVTTKKTFKVCTLMSIIWIFVMVNWILRNMLSSEMYNLKRTCCKQIYWISSHKRIILSGKIVYVTVSII